MTNFEDRLHVFIVRIWFEPREIEGKVNEMRGILINVNSGKEQYFTQMDRLPELITEFLNTHNLE